MFTLVSGAGATFWSLGGSAWPSALAVGGVIAVALRVWWVAERRVGLLANVPVTVAVPPAAPFVPPTAGILTGPDAEQRSFIQDVTASLEELQGTVRRLDKGSSGEDVARSVNTLIRKQDDLAARIGEVARSAKAAAEAAGAVKAQLLPQIVKLDEELEFFRKRFDRFEQDTRKRSGVRDADARLRELAEPIAALSERLLKAEVDTYPDVSAWQAELGEWQANINQFWSVVDRWDQSWPDEKTPLLRELLNAAHDDYAAVKATPGPAIPNGDFPLQQQWRCVAIVSARHRRHCERVMGRIRDVARDSLYGRD